MSFGIESKVYEVENSFVKPRREITVDADNNLSRSHEKDDLDLPHEDSEIKIIDNNHHENLTPATTTAKLI